MPNRTVALDAQAELKATYAAINQIDSDKKSASGSQRRQVGGVSKVAQVYNRNYNYDDAGVSSESFNSRSSTERLNF